MMPRTRRIDVVGLANVLGYVLFVGALIALPQTAEAASTSWTQKLDRYLRGFEQNGDFRGNIRVSRGGRALLAKSYGLASSTFGVPHSASSKFLIASVTKTFTAAAIVLLQADGRLSIEDELSKFLPDFPRANEIKIKHLLLHSSGLQDAEGASADDCF